MDKTLSYLFEVGKKHGLPFVMLLVAIWYVNQKSQKFEEKIFDCHDQMIQIYQENQDKLIKVIETNTSALEEIRKETT